VTVEEVLAIGELVRHNGGKRNRLVDFSDAQFLVLRDGLTLESDRSITCS